LENPTKLAIQNYYYTDRKKNVMHEPTIGAAAAFTMRKWQFRHHQKWVSILQSRK
jgi:hypothetical protein